MRIPCLVSFFLELDAQKLFCEALKVMALTIITVQIHYSDADINSSSLKDARIDYY